MPKRVVAITCLILLSLILVLLDLSLSNFANPDSSINRKIRNRITQRAPADGSEAYAGRMDVEIDRPHMPRTTLHAVEIPANGVLQLVPIGPTLGVHGGSLSPGAPTHPRAVRPV